ncbi:multidrug efflux pump subunit AcrB [Azospirillum lipoferum]|uniref:Efflux RND transporter permease subunit n=1 Tax=Azospirillum lipoferum TaxID=193 RepID=A0A5A9GM43_AZOLI|nr:MULTISPECIES: efflux RND transporter permease subunit [Azospirillum]KAA0594885.1 efflux RND transporter permease subunit [Azospirillum lipoferum]MCP1612785.1 multidrug efflux pump subunit AcrB [Azospirillum lipoferum]MDW5532076.1 efflux RND transporter permease subunit [Azospirillum sp. NL1]
MSIATWSVDNPLPSLLLFAALSLAGLWSFHALPVESLPSVEVPTVEITLRQAGAAPARLEAAVARPVEDQIATLEGVKHVATTIRDSEIRLSVTFELSKSLTKALANCKDAIDRVRPDLPPELEAPEVIAAAIDDDPVVTYALEAPGLTQEELSWFVDDRLARALRRLPGVGRVERVGDSDREVRLELDPQRLAGLGLTVATVSTALAAMQQDISGGLLRLGMVERRLRATPGLRQPAEIGSLALPLGDGRHITLSQIATIRDGVAEPRSTALLDGRPAVGLRVYRARSADVVSMAQSVAAEVERIRQADGRIGVTLLTDRAAHAREQFDGAMAMLYEGAALAVFVVWLFLRDWRATWIAACALPLSILPTFLMLRWVGYSMNMLTLLALSVVVGILVDDAIVEVENIERHARLGKTGRQATVDAVAEIALAVAATTMTIVVVFVPTALMDGVPGLFFQQFGWTAVAAVLASLLVARLLTPVMASRMLKPHGRPGRAEGRVMTAYLGCAGWCLGHRAITLLLALLVLLGSASLLPMLSTGFLPAADEGYAEMTFELPPGSSLAASVAVAERSRHAAMTVPGVARVFAAVGEGGSADGVRRGTLTLLFSPPGQRPVREVLERQVRAAVLPVPGARFSLGADQMKLIATGNDAAALIATAGTMAQQLREVGGLGNVVSTASLERPEILVRPRLQAMAELGVGTADLAATLRFATTGDFDERLAKLSLDRREIRIRTVLPDGVSRDLEALAGLRVDGRHGLVPLSAVAELLPAVGPAQIDRYDRERFVTIQADLDGLSLGDALAAARLLPAMASLPAGIRFIETGDAEIMGEMMAGFGTAILIGLLSMFCVLALLFRDILQPVTILSALPLSLGGALLALVVTGTELNVPSLIGLILLMGVVAKNSILLVEHALAERRAGACDQREALMEACRSRARPIVMTTLAMIAGMLPIALGISADASFRQPMALAVIGGLASSTLLSLVVVPVVFSCLDDLGALLRRRFAEV